MKINVSLTWWMWMVLTKFTWMCFLAEWGIASQMAHRRSTANHADEYHANAVSSPCLPYDFRHRWQLYRFRTPVYLVRESYDSPSEYHVPHHRQAHIGNDSTLYLLRSVCTPDKLYAQLKRKIHIFYRWKFNLRPNLLNSLFQLPFGHSIIHSFSRRWKQNWSEKEKIFRFVLVSAIGMPFVQFNWADFYFHGQRESNRRLTPNLNPKLIHLCWMPNHSSFSLNAIDQSEIEIT